jgi:hypothetical protein
MSSEPTKEQIADVRELTVEPACELCGAGNAIYADRRDSERKSMCHPCSVVVSKVYFKQQEIEKAQNRIVNTQWEIEQANKRLLRLKVDLDVLLELDVHLEMRRRSTEHEEVLKRKDQQIEENNRIIAQLKAEREQLRARAPALRDTESDVIPIRPNQETNAEGARGGTSL